MADVRFARGLHEDNEGEVDTVLTVAKSTRAWTLLLFTWLIPGSIDIAMAQGIVTRDGGTDYQSNVSPASVGRSGSSERGAAQSGDFDRPPEAKNRITDSLSYGAKIRFEYEYERNFDLDRGADDELMHVQPQFELAFRYEPTEWMHAFVNWELSKRFALRDDRDRQNTTTRLVLDEAYVVFTEPFEFDDVFEDVEIQIGRQKIDDDREWLYDEDLDAVRIFFETYDIDMELSVSREDLVRRDVLEENDTEHINNFIGYAEYEVIEDYKSIDEINLAAYGIFRDNRTKGDEELLLVGLRSTGEIGGLEYWADVAHVRGKDGSDDIRGYGYDVGGVYTFDAPFKPHLALGYAFGSGDENPDDNTDRAFRQTDLQGNSDKLGGVVSLKYYGEVFDPELSNMSIFTVGIGMWPSARSSIDLVYHRYGLDEPSDELRDAAVEEDLDGTGRELGDEIDLVFGYRGKRGVKAELNLGYFRPGRAFGDDADDDAFFVNFEVSFEF